MNTQTLLTIVVVLALLVWISYRQFTWRPVREGRVWLLPAILVLVGVVTLAQTATGVSAVDLGILGLEALISVGTGSAMGALARFRTAAGTAAGDAGTSGRVGVAAAAPGGSASVAAGRGLESRTGWLGLALWLVFIGVRVGFAFWGHSVDAAVLESSGAILVVLGVNRGARALVLDLRANRLRRDLAA